MKLYHTTESLAQLIGMTGTNARKRIASGEWKPSAETTSGKALFTEDAAAQIATREMNRKDGRAGRRRKGTNAQQPRQLTGS
jgi:hypothetical protein